MDFRCPICVSIICFLFHFFSFVSGDVVAAPPPFTINQTSLLQYLGNITIDLLALYAFGDSFIDPGNNNFLNTSLKSNFTSYGIDFDGKPNGRATNGRTVVDFIDFFSYMLFTMSCTTNNVAQVAGLPFPPSALDIPEGHVLSLDEQIALFENTTEDLKGQLSNAESFAQHMSKSLFFFHIGSNDLGLYWDFERHSNYPADNYSQLLIYELSTRLQKFYQLGARKFFVNNVSPIGCQPCNIVVLKPKTTQCDEERNTRILNFTKQIPPLLSHLQSTLPGSKFVLGDLYKFYEDVFASPASHGKVFMLSSSLCMHEVLQIKKACCIDQFRNQTRPCAPNLEPCKERNQHAYFDAHHPSESMHFVIARRFLKDSSVSSPINLLQLIQWVMTFVSYGIFTNQRIIKISTSIGRNYHVLAV
ncbi:GDSL esterase/lipase At1g71691-like [Durio zibethinus]|uniref:GDSL esterase/lipase At1g71691-like n=1 Tax=Durio zibethinus TaxID=66656 RepID=A0A6P5XHR7_DURZI|nr:GDSL esterase/lipase At1g71691-like [Durio zibethinus]